MGNTSFIALVKYDIHEHVSDLKEHYKITLHCRPLLVNIFAPH